MNKYIFPTALIILDLGANCSLTKNKAPTEARANKISSQSS